MYNVHQLKADVIITANTIFVSRATVFSRMNSLGIKRQGLAITLYNYDLL